MREIIRSLLIVKPKKPFLDWAETLEEVPGRLSLENLQRDCAAFLVPEIMGEEDEQKVLGKFYSKIFQYQLESWIRDESLWPEERDLRVFKKWFDFEFHSLIFDLGEDYWAYVD